MCGCSSCANCASKADGANYDPAQIALWINKYVYEGKATESDLQDAYPKVMVWLESKKLPFEEKSISDNKEDLKVIINDPNFLNDKINAKPGWKIAVMLIGFLLLGYYVFVKMGR